MLYFLLAIPYLIEFHLISTIKLLSFFSGEFGELTHASFNFSLIINQIDTASVENTKRMKTA